MQTALRLKTNVLPGGRIEVIDSHLVPHTEVELIVMLPDRSSEVATFPDVIAFLDSLPTVTRSIAEWEEMEQEFREGRESWER